MQVTIRTHHLGFATYLIIEDSDGASADLLMEDDETIEATLLRHIRDEKHKIDLHARRAARMQAWLDSFATA